MNIAAAVSTPRARSSVVRNIVLGGATAAVDHFIYPTVRTILAGNPWTQPWKGVASGLLGQAARDGGMEMVLLGMALHWFTCISAACILYLVVGRVRWLPRQWILLAVIHGV